MINYKNKIPEILVIGDLMVDQYLWGNCDRISPEAPVQIVKINQENKIILGLTNIHFRFGTISIIQYLSAIYNNSIMPNCHTSNCNVNLTLHNIN